ncbi:unnamed protein product [Arabidopsis thaliana]|uniref:(thale cress) hypothetical protein n=1 Tax=Arabidopsis thaliana TaxID=3702 RepID=A0A7G2FHR2_ARATH|nr:unnamed protein product [Arabidopsis thaliana]
MRSISLERENKTGQSRAFGLLRSWRLYSVLRRLWSLSRSSQFLDPTKVMCDGTRCGLCLLVVWPSFFEEMQRSFSSRLQSSVCCDFIWAQSLPLHYRSD